MTDTCTRCGGDNLTQIVMNRTYGEHTYGCRDCLATTPIQEGDSLALSFKGAYSEAQERERGSNE